MSLIKSLLLPVVAITYLTFCYTVHDRVVPVTLNGFISTSPAHLASVKSGITSVSILIIAIGLWPLKDLISDIHSEEFFRTLSAHKSGVPLAALNGISIPSFGTFETLVAIFRRHCSPYLTVAFIAGLLSIATSTLAPAALSLESVLFDSDMMAFKVGAITADTVYNVTDITPFKTLRLITNTQLAASIAWAETVLNVKYSFTQHSPDGGVSPYIVPWPVDLEFGTSARWLTDVVALRPACVWSNTNVSGGLDYRPGNISSVPFNASRTIFLSDAGVDLKITPSFSAFSSPDIRMIEPELYLSNHTNQARLSDGTIAWEIGHCVSGCKDNGPEIETIVKYDFTGIPTVQVIGADMTWEVAYLLCSPHPTIETREARSDSAGVLTVHGDKRYTKQDNLHPTQTALLLSYSTTDFSNNAGPSFMSMGSRAQAALIFGNDQINNINTTRGAFTITPLQNQAIADSYVRLLQSITKVYMGGKLATAYVPGRLSQTAIVFRSSMAHVAVSTGLFGLLTMLVIAAHFRAGKGEQFTLARIATALENSDIPAQLKRDAETTRGTANAGHSEEDVIRDHGDRNVAFDRSGGTLFFQSADIGRAI